MSKSASISDCFIRREFLRSLLISRLESGFAERYGRSVLADSLYPEALALAFDPDPQVAFRASAALEFAYFADDERFMPYMPDFLSNYLNVTNPSAHRHYSKMLEHMLRTGRLRLTDAQAARVAEAAFDRLIDPHRRIAVQVWSMEILFGLSQRLDWVEEHLEETVRHLMSDGSPGIRTHGGRLCARIKKRQEASRFHRE